MKKTSILYNLSILVSAGIFVKLLGMVNKIIITRILGVDGISMFALMMPTVMLFLGICSFSLSTSIQNIVSQNIVKKTYSNRDLMIKCFTLSTLLCCIISLITLIFNYYICHYLLRIDSLQKPFLYFIPMYFFASWGGVLKGYYHGHNKLNIYALAQGVEQVVRILFSVIIIIFSNKLTTEQCLILIVLSLGIGELFQFSFLAIYSLFFTKIKNETTIKYNYSDFIKTSMTLTFNRLISSIAFFFEPIVFSYAFTLTGLSSDIANRYFGILHGYVIPIVLTASFVSISIQQAILPTLSSFKNDFEKTNKIISKSMFLSFIPGALLCYLLFFYSNEILLLVYGQDIGARYLQLMAISSFVSYFDGVFGAILIVYSYEKKLLIFNICSSILKLFLIFVFVQMPSLNAIGLPLSYSIVSIISSIYCISKVIQITGYKINIKSILLCFVSLFVIFFFGYIYHNNLNIFLSIGLITFMFSLMCLIFYKSNFKFSLDY